MAEADTQIIFVKDPPYGPDWAHNEYYSMWLIEGQKRECIASKIRRERVDWFIGRIGGKRGTVKL